MAHVDVVAISPQTNYITCDDLRLGLSSQQAVGRLLRFWNARNIKKDGEFIGIVILLLDEKSSVIHAFIPADRTGQFRNVLQEGVIFGRGGFEVGRCTILCKITDHPFDNRSLHKTTIVELAHVESTIERKKFLLRKANHLQALANKNLEIPDVVGQNKIVQGSNLDEPTSTQHLVPYNLEIQQKYMAQINIECCNQSKAIKNLFKYITKRVDRAILRIHNENQRKVQETAEGSEEKAKNEINDYLECHYLSACEAMWRIFKLHILHNKSPVQRLPVHLPKQKNKVLKEGENLEIVEYGKGYGPTMFTEW